MQATKRMLNTVTNLKFDRTCTNNQTFVVFRQRRRRQVFSDSKLAAGNQKPPPWPRPCRQHPSTCTGSFHTPDVTYSMKQEPRGTRIRWTMGNRPTFQVRLYSRSNYAIGCIPCLPFPLELPVLVHSFQPSFTQSGRYRLLYPCMSC